MDRARMQKPFLRPGTAVPYGNRGHSGEGSALSTLVRIVCEIGIQLETVYCNGKYDLTLEDRDEAQGRAWGGRGSPADINEAIGPNKIVDWATVTDEQAIKDVLARGYFLFHGSMLTSREGSTLISGLKSIGGHAQALVGMADDDLTRQWLRDTHNYTLPADDWIAIHDQSWGANFNRFPDDWWPPHWGQRPEGVWCTRRADTMRIVQQWGDCIALSDASGWPAKDLPDWGSTEWL